MKWPRGRYNGKRIVGIEFKFVLDVTSWKWLPTIGHGFGMFHWLCFRSWTNAAYEAHWKTEKRSVVVKLDYETDPETGDVRIVQK